MCFQISHRSSNNTKTRELLELIEEITMCSGYFPRLQRAVVSLCGFTYIAQLLKKLYKMTSCICKIDYGTDHFR